MTRKLSDQIAIRVSPALMERLREDAERHGRTVAQSARFYLRKGLHPDADIEVESWMT